MWLGFNLEIVLGVVIKYLIFYCQVYSTLFAPLQITPAQFSRILSCRRKQLKILKVGEYYAREKVKIINYLDYLVLKWVH